MRTTLLGGLLFALLAMGVVFRAGREGSLLLGWLPRTVSASEAASAPADEPRSPDAAAAPAPQAPAPTSSPAASAPAPQVIAAGELSVLEAEAPEPMVRYVDSEGSTRMVRGLARVPAAHRAGAVVLRRDNVNIVNVPALSAVAFRDWQPAPNRNRHEVVLFSASWCGACESAKRYLDQHGVRYFERDIEADDSAKQEIVRILGQVAVPLLEVDGRYISGFRPDIYDRALR